MYTLPISFLPQHYKSIITIWLLLGFSVITFGQSKDILAGIKKDANAPTIQLKWYPKPFHNNRKVNVYRRIKGDFLWNKLNQYPIVRQDSISSEDRQKDDQLAYLNDLVNSMRLDTIEGFLFINVIIKSFESEVFSRFLGNYYEDTNISHGITYEYRITEIKGSKEVLIGLSDPVAVMDYQKGDPVNLRSVKQKKRKVTLNWEPEENRFFACNIYRMEIGTHQGYQKINNRPVMLTTTTRPDGTEGYPEDMYTDYSLEQGASYLFQIAGIDFFGNETKRTAPIEVFFKDFTPPKIPYNFLGKVDTMSVKLSWQHHLNDNDRVGTRLYRSTISDGEYDLIADLGPYDTTYTDYLSKPGPYYYYLGTYDAENNENFSQRIYSEVTDVIPPSAPIGLSMALDTGKITLRWKMNPEQDLYGYIIYRTVNADDPAQYIPITADPIQTNIFVERLPKNIKNKFYYKVSALDSSFNRSGYSSFVAGQMPDVMPPDLPQLRTAKPTESKALEISWSKNVDHDLYAYHLYRSLDIDGLNRIKINTEPIKKDKLKYLDTKVLPNTDYYYTLTAEDSSGNMSRHSNTVTGHVVVKKSTLEAPRLSSKLQKKKKSVLLSWNDSENETLLGYVVFCSVEGGNAKPVSGLITNDHLAVQNLVPKQKHSYHIQAYDKEGNSIRSNTVEVAFAK